MKNIFFTIICLLCSASYLRAGWVNSSFTFDGHARQYRTYIPAGYDPGRPASLIVVLHGLGGSMNDVDGVGITDIADTANIILLSPQALDYNSPLGVIAAAWNSGVSVTVPGLGTFPVNADIDDVGFIEAMMDATEANYSINNARIYACGASMGGFLTQRLACEASARFAAVASVMGTYAKALPECDPGKVLPVAHFHGTADEVVSYNGDLLYGGYSFPVGLSVDNLVAKWVDNNQCNTTPLHETWPDSNNDNLYVEHFTYSDAQARSRVELFKINGGTHFWYQYANTGGEIDYSLEIWKFFNKQYANSMSVQDISHKEPEIVLYPNPATDELYISASTEIKSVTIIDICGKVLYHNLPEVNTGINISKLAPGIYLTDIVDKKGNTRVQKFVKR